MRFEDRFELGYFSCYQISHEALLMAQDVGALMRSISGALDAHAHYRIFGQPTKERIERFDDALMNMKPWETPPSDPWDEWANQPLPEPIFTHVSVAGESTIITRCYSGWLKDEFRKS